MHSLEVQDAFYGTGICSEAGNMNGLKISLDIDSSPFRLEIVSSSSFHPTAEGHTVLRDFLSGEVTQQLGTANPTATSKGR